MVGTTILSAILGKIVIRIHSAEWYIEIDCFILSFLRSLLVNLVFGGARGGISSSDKLPDPNRGFQSRVCIRWLSAVMF